MAIAGLGLLTFGWVLVFVLPGSRFFAWLIMGIGVALIATAAIIDFRRVRSALKTGKGRFSVGTSLAISLFVAIILVINGISLAWNYRFDFTGLDQFTLSSQTKEALAEITTDVQIVTLFTPTVDVTIRDYARDLLAEYEEYTDRLSIRSVDPELEPDEARRYGISQRAAQEGVVIFQSEAGERRILGSRIASEAEHAFTSALLEVTGTRQKRIYHIVGHGEGSLVDRYASAQEGLLDALFSVSQLDLRSAGSIPDDAGTIVIAGPRADLTLDELVLIRDYLLDGGSAVFLLDPGTPETYRRIISQWWINVDTGIVIDPASFVAPIRTNPLIPPGRNAFGLPNTFLSGATATLPVEGKPEEIRIAPLLWSSDDAWVERGTGPTADAQFDAEIDGNGPLAMGVLIAATSGDRDNPGETRIAVVGDSDFAAGANFLNGGNGALFLTIVNWATASDEIIEIDRTPFVTRRLVLTEEQARFLTLTSSGLIPVVLLIAGAVVWWRRRQ